MNKYNIIFRKVYPILILILFFTVRCTPKSESPKELKIHHNETLSLGSDNPEASDHELFRSVTHIEVNQQGRIYVVNAGEASIRVYDEQGEFQHRFGNQGSGPGEFQTISAVLIDSKDRLLIVDSGLARVSAFSLDGDFIKSWELPSVTRVHQIKQLLNGKFVLVGPYNDKLVHITDSDFSKIEASFVQIEQFLTTNAREERVLIQFFPGKVEVLPELFNYGINSDGEWNLLRTIKGKTQHDQPASFSDFDQAKRIDMPMIFPGEGRYAAQFHSFSQGLYYDEGNLVHYSYQETNEEELELQSEYFSIDGNLIGSSIFDKMDRITVTILEQYQGNLYLSDNREFPKLRRLVVTQSEK